MEYSEGPTTKIAGSGKITVPNLGVFKISGSGRISPEEISTSGSSLIPGGLKIKFLQGRGSTKVDGSIIVDTVRFRGSARIDGQLECGELDESGSIMIEKDLSANCARVSGSARIGGAGNIEKELESSGSVMFGGDLVSKDKILYRGVMRVEGRVQSKSFEARLSHDESFIRGGIEADYVNIRQSHDDWRRRGYLRSADIVADEVILENVECDNVRGRTVRILGGCIIKGEVYYTETINVDSSSDLFKEPKKVE